LAEEVVGALRGRFALEEAVGVEGEHFLAVKVAVAGHLIAVMAGAEERSIEVEAEVVEHLIAVMAGAEERSIEVEAEVVEHLIEVEEEGVLVRCL
jgi:hypothetical protein